MDPIIQKCTFSIDGNSQFQRNRFNDFVRSTDYLSHYSIIPMSRFNVGSILKNVENLPNQNNCSYIFEIGVKKIKII